MVTDNHLESLPPLLCEIEEESVHITHGSTVTVPRGQFTVGTLSIILRIKGLAGLIEH
ncbi:hypothetical protein SAMN06264364_11833 [Quadrisphaera granulorum]|uniref:Uncharacterized protein n=1 Tax=Quadrisphaera granulorum TaxID=317664 RepID=A0A316A5B1_9ACTN|nr:hypothetical protein BXY45_11833 [Quadrisphaera granulorum]SZE97484.1 hypothetical protein SAMN06264364_11833 [Quadrisphaera granulorum]